jgi:hypothetical protein
MIAYEFNPNSIKRERIWPISEEHMMWIVLIKSPLTKMIKREMLK